MAEQKLTKSELKMKQRDPKKFAELQKIRARRGKGFLTSKTIRDAGTGKFDSKAGTPAEQRAVAHGKKIEAETGSKDKGQKAALAMMKKSRSKSNKEIASLAVDGGLIAFGGPLAGYVGRKALQSALGQQVLKSGVGKAATAGVKKLSGYFDKAGRAISSVAFAALPATAKLALRNADKAAAAAKAARVSQKAIDPSKAAAAQRSKTAAANKVRTDAAQRANRATEGRRATRGGSPANLRPGSRTRVGGSGSSTPQSKVGTTAALAAALAAKNMGSGKKKPTMVKPTAVKPTSRKVKPVDPYRYLSDNIDEEELSNKMPKKLRTLTEAMFGSDQTPENEMVRNPFTGKPMSLEYDFPEDPEDMKKGGSIKKKMKKGKVKKRAALRGQGKALRGF